VDRPIGVLLLSAVGIELVLLLVSFQVPAVARLLNQAPPSPGAWAIACLAPVCVPLADALYKRLTRRR
jgi:hypothetical protein